MILPALVAGSEQLGLDPDDEAYESGEPSQTPSELVSDYGSRSSIGVPSLGKPNFTQLIAPTNNLPAPEQAVYYPGASDGDSIQLASTQKKNLKERAKSFFSGFLPKTGGASEESARRMEEQKARAEQRRQQSLGAMAAESGLYSTDRHQAAMDTAKEAQSQMANNLPVVGTLKLLEEAGSGRDSITGRELGTGERLLATTGPATGVAAGFVAGIIGKLKIAAPKGGGNAFGLSGSVGAARQSVNWRSQNFVGHTFNRHGAGPKNTARLTGRAGGTGQPQGQWLDNQRAAEFLNDLPDIGEAATVRIPKGLGRVIRPDGTFVDAEWATAVISPNGFRTAFPIIP